MNISVELRRIADDLDKQLLAAANAQIEHRLFEIKRQFLENFNRSPGLQHLNAEEVWEKIKDSIRNDLQKNPREWSA